MKLDWLLALLVVLSAATTPGIATSNEPPLADAGLDQTVTRGTTVYLDGGGSRDPDGTIQQYEWTITSESGDASNATTPQCSTCEQTQFQAEATGTYRVTLEVTDDDGVTATDELFVTVEPGESPSVALSGPSRTSTTDPARFTADTDAGAAPLDRLLWKVDGERVATESLSGDASTDTHSARFPTDGTHSVSVVAVDEDGKQDTDERTITVTESGTNSSDSGPSDSQDGASGTAPPTDVSGPQLLTGHGDLTGDYELADGSSGTWIHDGAEIGQGSTVSRTFSPGVHELYATTDRGVATFSDGSRRVVADPAPEIEVASVENGSVVPVDVHATDEYGNLRSVAIRVDGDPVETLTTDRPGQEADERSLSSVERLDSLDPGLHTVTVRARDARGQTDVAVRTVEVPGPPEVVSAGFVQDGPLDQYHPRLDESRYTATYRVKVKLNGIRASQIDSSIEIPSTSQTSNTSRKTVQGNLVLEKDVYSTEIRMLEAASTITAYAGSFTEVENDSINITPAPPEIRIGTISPQNQDSRRRGMVLDARQSFDPDRSELNYDWFGVQGGHRESSRVPLDSFNAARLVVTDGQNQTSEMRNELSWFAPELKNATLEEEGPFYPNETVRVSVTSERYYLSKNTYENSTSFGVRSKYGTVVERERIDESKGEIGDPDPEAMAKWYTWTLEVPARAFLNDTPTAVSYPTEHPEVTYSIDLPEPELYRPTHTELRDAKTSVEYRVERPEYVSRDTTDEAFRDSLLDDGYSVDRVTERGRKYHMEEYVKVEDAEYDVDSTRFDNQGRREEFLAVNPDWSSAGTATETETSTETIQEWRSSKSGEGTFTGNTRQHLVEEGVYRTEKKFRYEDTETYETTETYEHTYTTTVTYVEYEQKCDAYGCVMYGRTVTDTKYHTTTRTRTVEKTRTVEQTYWSTRAKNPSHEDTGQRREITVQEPRYEQQYEFEVERERTESSRVYLAEKRVETQPAEYAWKFRNTMHERGYAKLAAQSPDVRIGEVEITREWTLKKQTGTEIATVSEPGEESDVLETIGRRQATLVRHYVREEQDRRPVSRTRERVVSVNHSESGYVTEVKIRNILLEKMEEKYDE